MTETRQGDDRRDRGQRLETVARDRWRDRRGVSGLADAAGVSRATLYSWFRGDTTPDLDAATRLADALEMPPSELLAILGGDEAPAEARYGLDEQPMNPPLMRRMARNAPDSFDSALRGASRSSANRSDAPAFELRQRTVWPSRVGSPSGGRVLDLLLGQPVMTCHLDEPIGPVLQRMFERGYSQLPVYRREKLVGLLTGDTITRWYAAARAEGQPTADLTPVSDVLAYAEMGNPFELVGPDVTVAETLILFSQAMSGGAPLSAVLVTPDATATGKPLGIVTVADLPRLGRFAR